MDLDGILAFDRWRRPRAVMPLLLTLGMLLIASGCLSRRQLVYHEMASQGGAAPRTIAILPFSAQSGTPELAQMVRESFYGNLSRRRFQDVEMDRIDRAVERAALDVAAPVTPAMLRELGLRLGCDAVVTGTVTEFERLFMGVYSQLSVGAAIAVYDTHDGRRLWADHYTARLHDGGLPLSPLEIPLSGARSGWNLRESQVVRVVDDLARTLADRLPGPHAPAATAAAWQFELQVGAYLDHRSARDQCDHLVALGVPAAVHSEELQQTVWHRVLVGPYPDEIEALQARMRLEEQLNTRLFLRRRPL